MIAEYATPNDKLYWVKTWINEDIKFFLSMWDAKKAQLQLDLIEERMNEKDKLIKNNTLNTWSINIINWKIEEHTTKFMEYAQKVQTDWKQEDYQNLQNRFNDILYNDSRIDTNSINTWSSDGMINEDTLKNNSSSWTKSENSTNLESETIEEDTSYLNRNYYT